MSAVLESPIAVVNRSPGSALYREIRKWIRMYSVFLQDGFAYRATALIWILTDTLPAIVMPLLWRASYNGRSQIGGFAPSQLTAYYLVLLAVTNLVQCHQMWEISGDIREGRLSAYLIRPFSYRVMNYISFLSWRIMRTLLFLPIFGIAILLFHDTLRWQDCHFSPEFFGAIVLGHFVSFAVTYALGMTALFLTESGSFFNAWYMPMMLFSGQMAPLALFPSWMRDAANILPFRYTISLPTEIFLGKLTTGEAHTAMGVQIAWIVAATILGDQLWRQGIKKFTGVGQ